MQVLVAGACCRWWRMPRIGATGRTETNRIMGKEKQRAAQAAPIRRAACASNNPIRGAKCRRKHSCAPPKPQGQGGTVRSKYGTAASSARQIVGQPTANREGHQGQHRRKALRPCTHTHTYTLIVQTKMVHWRHKGTVQPHHKRAEAGGGLKLSGQGNGSQVTANSLAAARISFGKGAIPKQSNGCCWLPTVM